MIADIDTMPAYSVSMYIAYLMPEYSVMYPKTSSESPIGMSKGGRDSSAMAATKKMPNPSSWGKTYQTLMSEPKSMKVDCDSTIPTRDSVPACTATAMAARMSGSS